MKPPIPNTASGNAVRAQEFVFLLCETFSMLAFANALEPLRHANRMARRSLYSWRLVSETGQPASTASGAVVQVYGGLEEIPREARIVVCAGFWLERAASPPVLAWLRKQARLGTEIGALCNGSYVLAKAGLLDGKRCTIHWENHACYTNGRNPNSKKQDPVASFPYQFDLEKEIINIQPPPQPRDPLSGRFVARSSDQGTGGDHR